MHAQWPLNAAEGGNFRRGRCKEQISANNAPHCHVSGMLKEYGTYFRKILPILNTNAEFCSVLSVAVTKEEISACVTHLVAIFVEAGTLASVFSDDNDIFSTFLSYCNLASSTPHVGQNLRQAIKSRQRLRAFRRNYHRKIIRDAGLNWKCPEQKISRDHRFEKARKIYAPFLHIPYPPQGEWVVEHPDVMHLWKKYLTYKKLPDTRRSHAPLHMIDMDSLFALIGPSEDAIVYDKDTKEMVLVVYRNICAVDELRDKADSVVIQAVDMLKNCRVSTNFVYVTLLFKSIHSPA